MVGERIVLTGGVGYIDKLFQKIRHLIMVPVGDRKQSFFVVLPSIRVLRIRDDQSLSQSVRILTPAVGMIPLTNQHANSNRWLYMR